MLFKIWLRKFFSYLKKIYHCPKLFSFHYIPKSTVKLLLLSKLYVGTLTVVYFCFIDYTKAFDCVDHNKLWKLLKEMGIPDHLTCLLRNLYAGQEATVRTGHGTTDWFQIGKGVCQGCILSPCLFNLYIECLLNLYIRVYHEKCWEFKLNNDNNPFLGAQYMQNSQQ